MAKITVTTDDGEVLNVWQDSRDEIGNISNRIAAASFLDDLAHDVNIARTRENRKADGTKAEA